MSGPFYLYGYKQKPCLFMSHIKYPERAQMCIMKLGYTCINKNCLKLLRAYKVDLKQKGIPNTHQLIGGVTL